MARLTKICIVGLIWGCNSAAPKNSSTPCSKTSAIGSAIAVGTAGYGEQFIAGRVKVKINPSLANRLPKDLLKILKSTAKLSSGGVYMTDCNIMIFPGETPRTYSFWTSEHCMVPTAIHADTTIFKEDGSLGDSVQISIDGMKDTFQVKSRILAAYMYRNSKYNDQLLEKVMENRFRPSHEKRLIERILLPGSINNSGPSKLSLNRISKLILRESNQSYLNFGGPLCNNVNKFTKRLSKISRSCFLYDDLFAFEGSLTSNGRSVDLRLNYLDFKKYDSPAAARWRGKVLQIPKASLSFDLKSSGLENLLACAKNRSLDKNTCQEQAMEIIKDPVFAQYVDRHSDYTVAAMGSMLKKSLSPDYSKIADFIAEEYFIETKSLFEEWNGSAEGKPSFASEIVRLANLTPAKEFLHYVGFFKKSHDAKPVFGAYDFRSIFDHDRNSLLVETYGLVLLHKGQDSRLVAGDSGAILMLQKRIPIASLSTINDLDSTSGGGGNGPIPRNPAEEERVLEGSVDLNEKEATEVLEQYTNNQEIEQSLISGLDPDRQVQRSGSSSPVQAGADHEPISISEGTLPDSHPMRDMAEHETQEQNLAQPDCN